MNTIERELRELYPEIQGIRETRDSNIHGTPSRKWDIFVNHPLNGKMYHLEIELANTVIKNGNVVRILASSMRDWWKND